MYVGVYVCVGGYVCFINYIISVYVCLLYIYIYIREQYI